MTTPGTDGAPASSTVDAVGPFRRRTVLWLVAIGAVSLVAAVLLSVFGEDLAAPPDTAGASTFSRSAIGHRAFAQMLRRLGIPVVISQASSAAKAGDTAALVVLEPREVDETLAELRAMLDEVSVALIVLPKWTGEPRDDRPGWLDTAELVAEDAVDKVLRAALDKAEATPAADADLIVRRTEGCGADGPALRRPQLLAPDLVEPLVTCGDLAVAGVIERTDGGLVYLISDPDLLSNHGLGEGDNAVAVMRIVEELREGTRALVIDETIHGYRGETSLFRALFEFPLVLATLQALIALATLLLAATVRFGAPLPAAPAIAAGKQFLIDNIAALLHFGGHAGHTLVRYLDATVRDVGRSLHAPPDLDDAGLRAWLVRVGDGRGVSTGLTELEAEVAAVAALRRRPVARIALAAERVHRWKQEMLRGAAPDRSRH